MPETGPTLRAPGAHRTASGTGSREGLRGKNGRPCHLVIHNCVDVDGIAALAAGAIREPGSIVCVGRLVSVKGQATLLRALPVILRAYPSARVRLIGTGPDEAALRELARSLRVGQRVSFDGWLSHDDAIRAMASADATVIPSDGTQEGFGLVVAEAMACGGAIVASDIPAFREVLGGEECGRLFGAREPAALAAAVTETLADPAAASRRAERARARVAERFMPARMAARYLAVYDAQPGA